ncbi:M48 family metalloprotease, partial [Streptomyces sp. AK04-3B]|uniref:M48 family metalloprotease n=1 Tax=Streptomyces sp. AK04-3B TaxID=3028650 RepID=UPI0029BA91C3
AGTDAGAVRPGTAPPVPPQQAPYQAAPPQHPYQAAPPQQQPPYQPPPYQQQPSYQTPPPQQQPPYQTPPYQTPPPHQPQYQQPPYQQPPYQQPPYQQAPYQATAQPPQFAPQPPAYGQHPPHAAPQQHPFAPQQSFAPQQHPQQAPGEAPPLAYPQQPYAPVPNAPGLPQVRRSADATSVARLLLNVPLFLGSLLVVWLISQALPSGLDVVLVVAWLASGALVFHRPTERGLARLLFKMRPPTGAELAALQPIWDDVTRRAGIDGSQYTLWLEDTDELNASAAAGHIVGVTRGAMRQPPQQLAAVLAHELGHHVGGHSWALLLGIWYAVPVRMFMTVVKFVTRFLFFFTAELSCLAAGVFVVVFGAFAVATFLAFPPAVVLYAIPFLLAWAGRQGELRADRFAGQLGYGPLLISVFAGWQAEGHDDAARKESPVARLMSSHPPLHQRIRALETFVA